MASSPTGIFHISSDGQVRPCKALATGRCRATLLPGAEARHFTEEGEGRAYAEFLLQRTHGGLATLKRGGKAAPSSPEGWGDEEDPGPPRSWLRQVPYGRYDHLMEDLLEEDLQEYTRAYGAPRVGTTRAVFRLGDGQVLKVPLCPRGEEANRRELEASQGEDPACPPSSLEWTPNGMGALRMEEVTPLSLRDPEVPAWALAVDCGQVGRARDGKVYAYDL